jgi:hypothetical protein
MIVTAFDIGSRNLAFTVVSYHNHFINVLYMNCIDLQGSSQQKQHWFQTLHSHLKQYALFWQKNNTVLIEQQLGFKSIVNYTAIQLASHIHAFFLLFYPHIRVIDYPSYWKTKVFHVHLSQKASRKKWAITFVRHYMQEDEVFLHWLDLFPKQDDICDCVLMTLAYAIQNRFISYSSLL